MISQQEINEFFDFCSKLFSKSDLSTHDATCEWFSQLEAKIKRAAEKYAIIEKVEKNSIMKFTVNYMETD